MSGESSRDPHRGDSPIACHLGALTESERERRSAFAAKLSQRTTAVVELPTGYAYRMPRESGLLGMLRELVILEGRCCPFLEMRILEDEASGEVVLEITGPLGVKAFLLGQFRTGNG